MKPRRVPSSNFVYRLPGGNEDNDLWCELTGDESGAPIVVSVWQPTDEERQVIADGGTVELIV